MGQGGLGVGEVGKRWGRWVRRSGPCQGGWASTGQTRDVGLRGIPGTRKSDLSHNYEGLLCKLTNRELSDIHLPYTYALLLISGVVSSVTNG